MAAGEYVSVHSQTDTEKADLSRERAELAMDAKSGPSSSIARTLTAHGLLGNGPSMAENDSSRQKLTRGKPPTEGEILTPARA
jgi:hypothetical protein